MKKGILFVALSVVMAFSACGGDHTAQSGKDTVSNRFDVKKDSSNVDTSKSISTDNSASGGTKIDTAKKNDSLKK